MEPSYSLRSSSGRRQRLRLEQAFCAGRRQRGNAQRRATRARDLESAAPIEAALRYRSDPEAADQLATIVARFANRTKPPRIAARLVGLTHSASVDAAQRWRAVALDLNNRQDAVSEAVCVFEALADGFGTEDELGACTARDLKICRERLASGEGTPETRRLNAAIEAAGASARVFHSCEMVNGKPTGETPATVLELYQAFVAATVLAVSDLPWRVLRHFTLRLHNEFSATVAALAFTEVALAQCTGKAFTADLVGSLLADRRVLRKELLSNELESAVRADKKRVARHVISELLSLAETAKERDDLQAALWKINRQRTSARVKYGFAAFAAVMLFAYIPLSGGNAPPLPRTDTHPSSASRYNQSAVPSNFAPRPPAPADPDAGQPERRPAPGSAVLTRAELRWCQYQRARVQAARDYLDALESNLSLPVDRYNAGVDAFNAFIAPIGAVCGDYKYHESDGSIIDAELKQHAATLKAEGQNLIATAVRAPDPRAVRVTSAAPQSTTPAATDRSDTNPVSGGSYNQAAVSSNVAPSPPAPVDPDAGQPEHRPVPGNTVLTRAELRWCRYQFARVDAARNHLQSVQSNTVYTTDQSKAGVDAFNTFLGPIKEACANVWYHEGDGKAIDTELRQHAASLKAEGENLIAIAVQSANPGTVQATSAVHQPITSAVAPQPTTSAATNSPTPAVSDLVVYGQGQADRRDWENWIAVQSGDFRAGADWWASVRSSKHPPSCDHAPGLNHVTASAGCNAARERLANVDRRRHTEADYWYGWNNP